MALEAHLQSLARRHQELEAAIASEAKHPSMDDSKLGALKRQKLHIKDEMARLRQDDRLTT